MMNRQPHHRITPQGLHRVAIVLSLGAMLGCTKAGHQEFMTFNPANQHITLGAGYTLAPPDVLDIHAPHAPEVDTQARIRHDGTIHLQLLGDIRVAGLTAREAASKIQLELSEYYKDPVVHVSVAQRVSKRIYLYGEVASRQGVNGDRNGTNIPITGRDTILNVLTTYQPTPNAWVSRIKVIRPDIHNPAQTKEMIIDFHKMVVTGDHTQNILLQEGDIVYVPPTPMAWIGYRIREILQPVAPVLQAYTTPAAVIDATDTYKDDDNNGGGENFLGRLVLP